MSREMIQNLGARRLSGHRCFKRYEECRLEGLAQIRRGPQRRPRSSRATSTRVLELRRHHPNRGALQLRYQHVRASERSTSRRRVRCRCVGRSPGSLWVIAPTSVKRELS